MLAGVQAQLDATSGLLGEARAGAAAAAAAAELAAAVAARAAGEELAAAHRAAADTMRSLREQVRRAAARAQWGGGAQCASFR